LFWSQGQKFLDVEQGYLKLLLDKPKKSRSRFTNPSVTGSVANLLLWKSSRFHDEKNTRFTKRTLDYKSKLAHSENGQRKCITMPTIDIVQLTVYQSRVAR